MLLLLVVVLSAICASAAQAEKVGWGVCYAVPTHWGGRYSDAGCTTSVPRKTGSYEWASYAPGYDEELTIGAPGTVALETAAGKKITCGTLAGDTLLPGGDSGKANPLWKLSGCESDGRPCTSEPEPVGEELPESNEEGEINNRPSGRGLPGWSARLGLVSDTEPSGPAVGLEYTLPKGAPAFGHIGCESGLTVAQIGSAKGKVSWTATVGPVNMMTHQLTETYRESAPGIQDPSGFQGKAPGHLEVLIAGYAERLHWEPIAVVGTFRDEAGEGGIEIRATRYLPRING